MHDSTELTGHDTGTVHSGDVELFYRRFGITGDAAPVLILHGAGYYDSADWIDVAGELATDGREVVAFDARGYGRSHWSPSADYSLAAQLADMTAVLDHLGWRAPVLLGHSRGGNFALRFVSAFPDRVAATIFADSCPGRTARGPAVPAGGTASGTGPATEPVYPTLAQALACTSRDPASLKDPAKRARLEEIFTPVDGGYRLALRDPRFQQGGGGGPFDGWAALAAISVPALIIRATKSLSFDEPSVERVAAEIPQARYVEITSGHDLANEAPGELVATAKRFLSAVRPLDRVRAC